MPQRLSQPTEIAAPRKVVDITPKFLRRFMEAVVISECLFRACAHTVAANVPDISTEFPDDPEKAFHCFVYKLAQISDNVREGSTVTSLAIVDRPAKFVYIFGSNQRDQYARSNAEDFIRNLLVRVRNMNQSGMRTSSKDFNTIFKYVLRWNLSRITYYRSQLIEYLNICLRDLSRRDSEEMEKIKDALLRLQELATKQMDPSADSELYLEITRLLILEIKALRKSEVENLIISLAKAGRITRSEHWCELRHFTGRLLSIHHAVVIVISTAQKWPELFDNFEVRFIPSGSLGRNPFKSTKSRAPAKEFRTIHDAIGRMTSDPVKMENARKDAEELQKFGIDDCINKKCNSNHFQPVTHAELLVLDYIEREFGTKPSVFFNGWKYIGSSKPTCKLCQYYFNRHPSGVKVRASHGNLYANWKVPDVYESDGAAAVKKRDKMVNNVLEGVRQDVFRIIQEKVVGKAKHDTNTDSVEPPPLSAPSECGTIVDDLATEFEATSIGGSSPDVRDWRVGGGSSTWSSQGCWTEDSDDDDDSGGCSLV